MENNSQEPRAGVQDQATPPEWQVAVRRITKEDGRYLIFYDFAPGSSEAEMTPETVREGNE